ncbi:MAG: hypothetical protein AB1589_33755 [Cyanobacteriota bacterium]
MNIKFFIPITAIILTSGLSPPATAAQASSLVETAIFNNILVQHSSLTALYKNSASSPPVDDAPDDRSGAGTHAK